MPYIPYYNPYLETNPKGDSYNGTTGAKTPGAVKNQVVQQQKPSGNAYQQAIASTAPYAHLLYGTPKAVYMQQGEVVEPPGGGGGYVPPPQQQPPPPVAPPPVAPPGLPPDNVQQVQNPVVPPSDPTRGRPAGRDPNQPPPPPPPPPPVQPPADVPPGPQQGSPEWFNMKADEYSQNPGYEWLAGRGDIVQRYQTEMFALDPSQRVHITAWLASKGYIQGQGDPSPQLPNLPGAPGGGTSSGGSEGGYTQRPPADVPGLQEQDPQYLERLLEQLNAAYQGTANTRFRDVRHQAGVSGLQNSGAFANVLADEATNLATQQGSEIGKLMQASSEAERTRQLQEILGRLGLEGVREGADASRFGSSTAAGAGRYGDQLRYLLGMSGLDVDRELGYAGYDVTREGNALEQERAMQELLLKYLSLLNEQNPDQYSFGAGPILGGVFG